MGEKHSPGNACFVHRQQDPFLSGYVDHINMSCEGSPSGTHVEKMDETRWAGEACNVS